MVIKEIEEKISQLEKGSVFSANDWIDYGSYDNIRKILSRLEQRGKIRRVIDGFYDVPYFSLITQTFTPVNIHELAYAIARNFNWTIAPSGAIALNILGLSTQVPHTWKFISDGPYRQYQVGNLKLMFFHRNNRSLTSLAYNSILTIEALKYLGKEYLSDEILAKLAQVLTDDDIANLKLDSQKTSKWIYHFINQLEIKR